MARKRLTSEEYIEKVKLVHGDTYDLSETHFISYKDRIDVICPKHGKWNTNPTSLLKSGCKECFLERKRNSPEDFIRRSNEKHNNKYDYTESKYTTTHEPVTIICPNHGEFKQAPSAHMRGANCPQCALADNHQTQEQFIERSKSANGDKYDYSKVTYIKSYIPVTLFCNDCQKDFTTYPHTHLSHGYGCHHCARSGQASQAQKDVESWINTLGVEAKSDVKLSDSSNLEVDILLPAHNLGIEYNGVFWHSENKMNNAKQIRGEKYHLSKTELAEKEEFRLLHVFENEWYQKRDIVKSIIRSQIGNFERVIHGRKCSVQHISTKQAKGFCIQNHIQGYAPANVKYGLYLEDELVSVMTFVKPRFHKKYEWEISRYCNLLNTKVHGSAQKLWKEFKSNQNPQTVISYSDRRYFAGGIYKSLGFEFQHHSKPNYFYFKPTKPELIKFHSRNQFQKHKLPDLLEDFNPDKTEWENMLTNGWCRIWDCGNSVWVYQK